MIRDRVGQPVAVPMSYRPLDEMRANNTAAFVNAASSTTRQVSVANNAAAHIKGAWVELIASTDQGISGLVLSADTFANGTDTSRLLDIGVGAAAAEQVIAENIPIGFSINVNALWSHTFTVPVAVRKGSRIAIRCQGAEAGDACTVSLLAALVNPIADSRPQPRKLVTMGANTATSSGVVLPDPAVNNTKSAWTQITAATAQPLRALMAAFTPAVAAIGSRNYLVDIGRGAAGSEVVLSESHPLNWSSNEAADGARFPVTVGHIPAGTRLAIRYASSGAVNSSVAAVLIGVPY